MKVSVNTLKQYIFLDLPPVDELVKRINAQLGGVEEVISLAEKYKDARIVRVVECEKHPNADKLSICKIDAGDETTFSEYRISSDETYVQVVCGAPNVHADMWAVWLPPTSTVPSTFEDEEPFVLGARELRGVMSNGMLASAEELALGDDHSGIIEITEADVPYGAELVAGGSFSQLFGLDDTIIDIENKMFTHRPDLFGQLGVAREINAILQDSSQVENSTGTDFNNPDWYSSRPEFAQAEGLELNVFNDVPEAASRFMAVALKDITNGPSPLWLRCHLVALGAKSINHVVDITNYLMLLTAQPVHAYDYDTLRGATLGVRLAREGETVTLLNGKTYALSTEDIVIADGEGVVGLGGVMGGASSEVSAETKNIVIEVANFDMYKIRKTSMRHGLFTDAVTRNNKGQSPLQTAQISRRLLDILPGNQASMVYDLPEAAIHHNTDSVHNPVQVSTTFINERLGAELTDTQIGNILRPANFVVEPSESDKTTLVVTAPFWRTDIALPEDIVEEVGRLYGYDRLPRVLPLRSTKPTPRNAYRELVQHVRDSLARAGAHEILTYSFVHERVLQAVGQDQTDAYQLSNALSPDLQYYRLSLTPSLLDKVHTNIKAGHSEFALFEIGKSHSKKAGLDEAGLPVEPGRIALAYAAKKAHQGAAYYHAKRLLDCLAADLGMKLEYKPLAGAARLTVAAPFVEPRSARVIDQASGQAIGVIGEYTAAARKNFKLPEYSAGFELLSEGLLLAQKSRVTSYRPLSRYPSVERDVCFEVAGEVSYDSLTQAVAAQLEQTSLQFDISPLDIYQSADEAKRLTVRIRLTPFEATLTSEAVNTMIDEASRQVAVQIDATII